MEILIRNQVKARIQQGKLRELAERLLRIEAAPESAELSVLFTDDETMRGLNSAYRKVDAPTDVLAFPQESDADEPGETVLGDVVISVETARRQAKERRLPMCREIELLLAHGILHLLGYNDEAREEREEMMRKAEELLKG